MLKLHKHTSKVFPCSPGPTALPWGDWGSPSALKKDLFNSSGKSCLEILGRGVWKHFLKLFCAILSQMLNKNYQAPNKNRFLKTQTPPSLKEIEFLTATDLRPLLKENVCRKKKGGGVFLFVYKCFKRPSFLLYFRLFSRCGRMLGFPKSRQAACFPLSHFVQIFQCAGREGWERGLPFLSLAGLSRSLEHLRWQHGRQRLACLLSHMQPYTFKPQSGRILLGNTFAPISTKSDLFKEQSALTGSGLSPELRGNRSQSLTLSSTFF